MRKRIKLSPMEIKLIKEALELNMIQEIEYLKRNKELQKEHKFSEDFEKKMKSLLTNENAGSIVIKNKTDEQEK